LALAAEDQSLESIATRVTLLEQGTPQAAVPAAALAAGISAAPPAAPAPPVAEKPSQKPPPKAEPAPKSEAAARVEAPREAQVTAKAEVASRVDGASKAEARTVEAAPRAEVPAAEGSRPSPEAARKPGGREPIPAAPVTLQRVRSLWDQIRLRAEVRQKPLKGPLSRATVDAVDADSLTIGVSDALHEGIARDKLSIIEDAVADVVGRRLRIVIRARTPATSAHRAPPPAASASAPAASASAPDGEVDLLAYARKKLGGTETT